MGFYDGSLQLKSTWDWPLEMESYQTQDARSPYGCYDMAGNLWEWCFDWHDAHYYGTYPPDEWPPNPHGPASGTFKVCRGSSWQGTVPLMRTSNRVIQSPHITYSLRGFRLAAGAH